MKKGISAVIAIVLILMITIALAAMAYVWFTTVFGEISEEAGESAGDVTESMQTRFSIEAAKYNLTNNTVDVSVRNTGTGTVDLTNVAVYIDDISRTVMYVEDLSMDEGENVKLIVDSADDTTGLNIRVSLKNGVPSSGTVS